MGVSNSARLPEVKRERLSIRPRRLGEVSSLDAVKTGTTQGIVFSQETFSQNEQPS